MFAVLVVVAVAAALLGVGLAAIGRRRRVDEVEGFHRARRMTSEWAHRGVTAPLIADLDDADRTTRT